MATILLARGVTTSIHCSAEEEEEASHEIHSFCVDAGSGRCTSCATTAAASTVRTHGAADHVEIRRLRNRVAAKRSHAKAQIQTIRQKMAQLWVHVVGGSDAPQRQDQQGVALRSRKDFSRKVKAASRNLWQMMPEA